MISNKGSSEPSVEPPPPPCCNKMYKVCIILFLFVFWFNYVGCELYNYCVGLAIGDHGNILVVHAGLSVAVKGNGYLIFSSRAYRCFRRLGNCTPAAAFGRRDDQVVLPRVPELKCVRNHFPFRDRAEIMLLLLEAKDRE